MTARAASGSMGARMADVMLMLGAYQFGVSTAAYQQLQRSTEYRWTAQARIGANDALQFTGYGADEINVAGVIYPHYRGGLGQVAALRAQADLALPLPLISGTGAVLGLWVVVGVTEGQRTFDRGGAPRAQEFSVRLRRYDQSLVGVALALLPF